MSARNSARRLTQLCILALTLSGCFNPPFNNFRDDHRAIRQVGITTALGAGAGAVAGSTLGNTATGAVIGGVIGASAGLYKNTKRMLLKELQDQGMQYIEYGDTMTLLIPTDRYFLFDSPHLNDLCYPGLNNIIRLLRYYPNSPIYVAAFTDDVGTRHHKRMLSQARAETLLTFLWAFDIHAHRLHAEGYADKHAIGDNHWIHGSAYNRRIELQWQNGPVNQTKPIPYLGAMK